MIISGGKCVEGLPDWILTGDPEHGPQQARGGHSENAELARSIKFTPEILQGLAADLLRRYTAAFGGKKYFLEAMRRDGLPPDDKMPVLKKEFEKFSKSPY